MFKVISLIAAMCAFACCTMSPRTSLDKNQNSQKSEIKLKAQDVVTQCLTPHEAFGFQPQPVPGIPVLVARHAECLGQTNILVALWPGKKSRVNLLYVEMLIERYVVHLQESGEYYQAVLQDVSQVIVDPDEQAPSEVPAFAAVYKLVHKSPEVIK